MAIGQSIDCDFDCQCVCDYSGMGEEVHYMYILEERLCM